SLVDGGLGDGDLTANRVISDPGGPAFQAPPIPQADLSVSQTASPSAAVGKPLTFTLLVRNGGPSAATGVVLTDTLPGGVAYQSSTTSQGTVNLAGSLLTILLGSLAPGATASVTITVIPAGAGSLSNHVNVRADQVDPGQE